LPNIHTPLLPGRGDLQLSTIEINKLFGSIQYESGELEKKDAPRPNMKELKTKKD
jgi:hypothetical protein